VIAVALTSSPPKAGFPLHLALPDEGLPKPSWIKIGQIRTLSVNRIQGRLTQVEPEVLAQVLLGLNEILGA
jgi:mRNA interferase MazF